MTAKILLALAVYLFASVWAFCHTDEEMREMEEVVYVNADQWDSVSVYIDPSQGGE